MEFTGAPAREVLKDACQDLMMMCQHVRSTFDTVVADYKTRNPSEEMDTDDSDNVGQGTEREANLLTCIFSLNGLLLIIIVVQEARLNQASIFYPN